MRFKKIISMALALGILLLSLMVFQMFQKTQLVMFDSISLNMPVESVEKVFGKPNEIVEETETGYHNPWRAKDPYLFKTGRLFEAWRKDRREITKKSAFSPLRRGRKRRRRFTPR